MYLTNVMQGATEVRRARGKPRIGMMTELTKEGYYTIQMVMEIVNTMRCEHVNKTALDDDDDLSND